MHQLSFYNKELPLFLQRDKTTDLDIINTLDPLQTQRNINTPHYLKTLLIALITQKKYPFPRIKVIRFHLGEQSACNRCEIIF